MPDLGHAFGSEFRLSWIALLPAAVILLLSVVQAGGEDPMIASIVTAIPVCIGLQNMAFTELPELLLNGFHSTDVTVAAMLNGGGITSMLKVGAIVCISSSYSGIFPGNRNPEWISENGLFACRQDKTIFCSACHINPDKRYGM